jgi:hypothetical protein
MWNEDGVLAAIKVIGCRGDAEKIQYKTIRKLRSHMSNFVHTTPGGLGSTFIADDGKGGKESGSPTNSNWFKRFMCGSHKRMGDIWIPDPALMIWELLCCQTLLESDEETFEGDVHGQLKTTIKNSVDGGKFGQRFCCGFERRRNCEDGSWSNKKALE